MTFNRQLGQRIKRFRVLRGLSQAQLAQHLNISFQQLQKNESGKNRVSAERLVTLAAVFGVTVTDLLYDDQALPAPSILRQDLVVSAALVRCTPDQKAAIARMLDVFGVAVCRSTEKELIED